VGEEVEEHQALTVVEVVEEHQQLTVVEVVEEHQQQHQHQELMGVWEH
jgi:hypothetical protein